MSVRAGKAHDQRDRAREARLEEAKRRRLELDPDQVAREHRIDEAVVDVAIAGDDRDVATQAVIEADAAACAAIERLLAERLSIADVAKLTGLDLPTIRRLRRADTGGDDAHTEPPATNGANTGGAGPTESTSTAQGL